MSDVPANPDSYDPQEIELRWQQHWSDTGAGAAPADGDPFYLLEMFPYPSGRIHMGHVRNYTIGDVLARFLTANGRAVLHPMGWDAFGLPAEQAAIKRGIPPAAWTKDNIDTMRVQLQRMGFCYDWDREIATCDKEYYRWEQLFFVRMLERGIAYRKSAKVNWCDECGTVLANEQVDGDECWRGHSPVRQKELDQWFLRITDYADELLEGLEELGGWPEKVVTMQRNWIGRSTGVEIDFEISETDGSVTVFTTRADTLYGCTFVSLAVEHPLATALARAGGNEAEVHAFIEKVAAQEPFERADGKDGVFTGCYAINPVNDQKVPIYLANFVLMDYGTGAVMAVPAHDQRDFEFATRMSIPIDQVIAPADATALPAVLTEAYVDNGILHDSGEFDGKTSTEARGLIAEKLAGAGKGREVVHYRLRDWGISRQRYWGTPIPVIYCDDCGAVPVPEQDLPVVLPTDIGPLEGGKSPLPGIEEFVQAKCPNCSGDARRETDTMDTFFESSWYFLRFTSPNTHDAPFDKEALRRWLPVSQYVGGVEHAVLHLLYSRFFTRVLRDLGFVEISEPIGRLLTQGMVIKDGAKMSKSRGNVVDPDDLVNAYGADTARLFSLFAAPPEKDLEWSEHGVEGASRFLARVWRLGIAVKAGGTPVSWDDPGAGDNADSKALWSKTHETIMRVTRDIGERMHFNTAVAATMELVNATYEYRAGDQSREADAASCFAVTTTVRLLMPFVPHLSSELWSRLVEAPSIEDAGWPSVDEAALVKDVIEVVVQINGKLRAKLSVAADIGREDLEAAALSDERIVTELSGREPRKVIVVPGRLVNLVV
jgi:leucyl-tRNA synthetase